MWRLYSNAGHHHFRSLFPSDSPEKVNTASNDRDPRTEQFLCPWFRSLARTKRNFWDIPAVFQISKYFTVKSSRFSVNTPQVTNLGLDHVYPQESDYSGDRGRRDKLHSTSTQAAGYKGAKGNSSVQDLSLGWAVSASYWLLLVSCGLLAFIDQFPHIRRLRTLLMCHRNQPWLDWGKALHEYLNRQECAFPVFPEFCSKGKIWTREKISFFLAFENLPEGETRREGPSHTHLSRYWVKPQFFWSFLPEVLSSTEERKGTSIFLGGWFASVPGK